MSIIIVNFFPNTLWQANGLDLSAVFYSFLKHFLYSFFIFVYLNHSLGGFWRNQNHWHITNQNTSNNQLRRRQLLLPRLPWRRDDRRCWTVRLWSFSDHRLSTCCWDRLDPVQAARPPNTPDPVVGLTTCLGECTSCDYRTSIGSANSRYKTSTEMLHQRGNFKQNTQSHPDLWNTARS